MCVYIYTQFDHYFVVIHQHGYKLNLEEITIVNLLIHIQEYLIIIITVILLFYITSAVKVNALTQIPFNSTNIINAARIFCLTCGPTSIWRTGDAQCCQLNNSADPFSNFFSLQINFC